MTLNNDEVDSAFWIPLQFFVQNTPIELYPIDWYNNETFWYRNYTYNTTTTNSNLPVIIASEEEEEVSRTVENNNKRIKRQKRRRRRNQHQYSITGLTAHVAHQVARMAFPTKEGSEGFLLFRLIKRQRSSYWNLKYFDFSTTTTTTTTSHDSTSSTTTTTTTAVILHQYDHEWQRRRKQNAANKKNRLPLGCGGGGDSSSTSTSSSSSKSYQIVDYTDDPNYQHAFQLIALEGKIVWTLAAMDRQGKEDFQQRLNSLTT